HNDIAASHVLAAVVADDFDDCVDARIADRKALAGHAADEHLAARRAVKRYVAGDDIFLRRERAAFGRVEDNPAAAQALAKIVVGVALQNPRQAPGHERAEALAGAAFE